MNHFDEVVPNHNYKHVFRYFLQRFRAAVTRRNLSAAAMLALALTAAGAGAPCREKHLSAGRHTYATAAAASVADHGVRMLDAAYPDDIAATDQICDDSRKLDGAYGIATFQAGKQVYAVPALTRLWRPDATPDCRTEPHPDTPPAVDAGPGQSVQSDQTVTLDGSASSDPDNDAPFYPWSRASGNAVTLSNSNNHARSLRTFRFCYSGVRALPSECIWPR